MPMVSGTALSLPKKWCQAWGMAKSTVRSRWSSVVLGEVIWCSYGQPGAQMQRRLA